jgi:hypothetical protein
MTLTKKTRYKKPKWAVEQIRRADGRIEDICEHGVGHPNADYLKELKEAGKLTWQGIHGCCSCCFPKEEVKMTMKLTKAEVEQIWVDYRCEAKPLNTTVRSLIQTIWALEEELERNVREFNDYVKFSNQRYGEVMTELRQAEAEIVALSYQLGMMGLTDDGQKDDGN